MGFTVSNDLTVNNILKQISEYDIFKAYCTPFTEVGKMFTSELREDHNPTCKISPNIETGDLMYGDFNGPSYNCFKYVQVKHGADFNTALNIINRDFKLNLFPTWSNDKSKELKTVSKVEITNKTFKTKQTVLKKRKRDWSNDDVNYWDRKYYISRSTLIYFNVEPIDYYWVNNNRFKCNTITYSYEFGNGARDIYSPYNTYSRFPASTTKADKHIYGYKQLPKTGTFCFIVSSLKEVMTLYEMGINAVGPQAEGSFLPEWMIKDLKERFTEITILFDMDNAGNRFAKQFGEKYNIKYCQFPDNFKEVNGFKDLSDGIEINRELIEEILNNYETYY